MKTKKLAAITLFTAATITLSSCFMSLDDPSITMTAEEASFCGGGDVAKRVPLSLDYLMVGVIKRDGSFWNWGRVTSSDNNIDGRALPVRYGKANDWASMSVTYGMRIGLKRDGSLWSDVDFSLANNRRAIPIAPVTRDCDWLQVSSHGNHVAAIKTDGSLWAWGDNADGQLGDGTTEYRATPIRIGNSSDWKSVSTTYSSTLAIKTDGTLWGWGQNYAGLFGADTTNKNVLRPKQVGTVGKWASLAFTFQKVAAIQTDGTLWTTLWNSSNQSHDLTQLGSGQDWASVSIANEQIVALKKNGTLWTAGDNSYGQLGHASTPIPTSFDCMTGQTDCRDLPSQVGTDSDWIAVAAESNYSAAMRSDGRVFVWGSNRFGQLGNGESGTRASRPKFARVGAKANWLKAHASTNRSAWDNTSAGQDNSLIHALALDAEGDLWAWDGNDFGQLGDGTTTNRKTPTRISSTSAWAEFSLGTTHTLARKQDGTLWAWGKNDAGQLGTGAETGTSQLHPSRIGNDADWATISAGPRSSAGVKKSGTLWSWGYNSDSPNTFTPTQVGTQSDWAGVSLSSNSALAIKTDGSLWVWGRNDFGQGDFGKEMADQDQPKQVGTDRDWTAFMMGQTQAVALKRDGTLWAWGNVYLNYGSSGGTQNYTLSPAQVGTNSNWSRLLPFGNNSFRAMRSDGTAWEWNTREGVLTQIEPGYDWTMLDGPGTAFMIGIKSDGTLWTRGENYVGELGLGDSQMENNTLTPTEVIFP